MKRVIHHIRSPNHPLHCHRPTREQVAVLWSWETICHANNKVGNRVPQTPRLWPWGRTAVSGSASHLSIVVTSLLWSVASLPSSLERISKKQTSTVIEILYPPPPTTQNQHTNLHLFVVSKLKDPKSLKLGLRRMILYPSLHQQIEYAV